jgi:hypothetical protein
MAKPAKKLKPVNRIYLKLKFEDVDWENEESIMAYTNALYDVIIDQLDLRKKLNPTEPVIKNESK